MPVWNVPEIICRKAHDWSKGALPRFYRERSGGPGWLDSLTRLGSELEALAGSTEGEFLSLGEELQYFYKCAKEISEISTSVAELLTGEEIAAVIEGFRDVISRIKGLEEESKQRVETLHRVLGSLTELQRQLDGFHRIVRSLHVLCLYLKIESAQLGERGIGFNDLTDQVNKLALEIEDRRSRLLARSESLSHLIGRSFIITQNLENRQHAQARMILDKTMVSLDSITEKHLLSSDRAKHISLRYDAISTKIGEIVASMQFHDITRQRMEHAKEALDSIIDDQERVSRTERQAKGDNGKTRGESEGGDGRRLLFARNGRGKRSEKSAELSHLAGGICELQMAQLCRARDELVSAVKNIADNLIAVANLVSEISSETKEMAGTADEIGRSSLAEVEAGLATVTTAFSTFADINRELSQATGTIGRTLGDMSLYEKEIEGIGAKIMLIALNAIVKTADIGEEGAALGMLAEAIQQLSTETRQQTQGVSEMLRSIASMSMSLDAGMEADVECRNEEMVRVGEALRKLLNTLKSVNESIVTLLTRIDEGGGALSSQILGTVEGITVHQRVNAGISSVVSKLGEIAALAGLQTADGQPGKEEHLRALEMSYTMEIEREVHQAVVTADAGSEKPSSPPLNLLTGIAPGSAEPDEESDEETEEDLGDNVELF
jgi:hypothetical protein